MWECDFPFAKMEKKTPCPKCEAQCGQHYDGKDVPVHFKGQGWSQPTGHLKMGGSDEGNLKLQQGCRDRMATGWQAYSKYTPSKAWIESNNGRRLSDREVREKLDASKKLSAHNYDKAGINPHNKYKPQ